MAECKQCGKCCISAQFKIANVDVINRKKTFDMSRWLSFHGCDTYEKDNKLYINIPTVCSNLSYDKDKYFCRIYDIRPELCRRFTCENIGGNGG